jgi:hypothetical protein
MGNHTEKEMSGGLLYQFVHEFRVKADVLECCNLPNAKKEKKQVSTGAFPFRSLLKKNREGYSSFPSFSPSFPPCGTGKLCVSRLWAKHSVKEHLFLPAAVRGPDACGSFCHTDMAPEGRGPKRMPTEGF